MKRSQVAICIILSIISLLTISVFVLWILWYGQLSANVWDPSLSKFHIMEHVPEEFKLEAILHRNNNPLITTLKYPVVFKDNYCTTNGQGVELIHDSDQAQNYLNTTKNDTIIQQMCDYPYEFGISYERPPWTKVGKIISVVDTTENRACHLRRDFDEIHSQCNDRGSFTVRNDLITPALHSSVETVSQNIPGFYVGRYDVKTKSIEDLKQGRFKVIELNGVCGNDLENGCNSKCRLGRITFGLYNMLKGKAHNPIKMAQIMRTSVKRAKDCRWFENAIMPSSSD